MLPHSTSLDILLRVQSLGKAPRRVLKLNEPIFPNKSGNKQAFIGLFVVADKHCAQGNSLTSKAHIDKTKFSALLQRASFYFYCFERCQIVERDQLKHRKLFFDSFDKFGFDLFADFSGAFQCFESSSALYQSER